MTNDLAALAGVRVLIVEDSFLVAEDLADTVTELGCTVVGPAGTLAEGLRHAADAELDGALLDVNLSNNETSFPIAELLRERGVPFVFLTGYDLESAFPPELKAVERLAKPLDARRLAQTMMDVFPSGGS
jgi:DNA-binding LytR/AlgR family response regulator